MARTEYIISKPGFVVDHSSADLTTGHSIDWSNVPASYEVDGHKHLQAGKFVAIVADGIVPMDSPAASAAEARLMLVSSVTENSKSQARIGVGCYEGGSFYENLLPDAAAANLETWKTQFNDNGTGAAWHIYRDTSAS